MVADLKHRVLRLGEKNAIMMSRNPTKIISPDAEQQ
jgi:hypothetical protein